MIMRLNCWMANIEFAAHDLPQYADGIVIWGGYTDKTVSGTALG